MFFRHKLGKLIVIFISTFIALSPLYAGWWEGKDIPLPSGAQEANQETRRIGGSEFLFTYYSTTQENADSIKAFYRMRLPNLGWKEKELLKDLQQVQNFQVNSSFSNALGQNLMFEKGQEALIITFMPEGAFRDGKTRFTIASGKLDFKKQPAGDENFAPELLAKPKKDVAPVYPGASLINLSEGAHFLQAGYFTKDGLEAVSAFYKDNMPRLGWTLKEEGPIQENVLAADKNEIAKYCPECANNANIEAKTSNALQADMAKVELKNIVARQAELVFVKENKVVCNVVISERNAIGVSAEDLGKMTVIMVNYEEK